MKTLNVKLNPETDKDIIDFMKDKPRTLIIKTAIREYMSKTEESSTTTKKADPDELFGSMED